MPNELLIAKDFLRDFYQRIYITDLALRADPLVSACAWIADCMHWRGRVLTGSFAHWCAEFDYLPVDHTSAEFECCQCYEGTAFEDAKFFAGTQWSDSMAGPLCTKCGDHHRKHRCPADD